TPQLYTLPLHDALPIYRLRGDEPAAVGEFGDAAADGLLGGPGHALHDRVAVLIRRLRVLLPHAEHLVQPVARQRRVVPPLLYFRSEEHTSELQSRENLV